MKVYTVDNNQIKPTRQIIKLCAWCPKVGRHRKEIDGEWVADERKGKYPLGTASHGICPECDAREFGDL